MNTPDSIFANKLIDALGGTVKVCILCDVTSGAVSQWRTNGIPGPRLMYLRAVRPKIYKAVQAECAAPQAQAA